MALLVVSFPWSCVKVQVKQTSLCDKTHASIFWCFLISKSHRGSCHLNHAFTWVCINKNATCAHNRPMSWTWLIFPGFSTWWIKSERIGRGCTTATRKKWSNRVFQTIHTRTKSHNFLFRPVSFKLSQLSQPTFFTDFAWKKDHVGLSKINILKNLGLFQVICHFPI